MILLQVVQEKKKKKAWRFGYDSMTAWTFGGRREIEMSAWLVKNPADISVMILYRWK